MGSGWSCHRLASWTSQSMASAGQAVATVLIHTLSGTPSGATVSPPCFGKSCANRGLGLNNREESRWGWERRWRGHLARKEQKWPREKSSCSFIMGKDEIPFPHLLTKILQSSISCFPVEWIYSELSSSITGSPRFPCLYRNPPLPQPVRGSC